MSTSEPNDVQQDQTEDNDEKKGSSVFHFEVDPQKIEENQTNCTTKNGA